MSKSGKASKLFKAEEKKTGKSVDWKKAKELTSKMKCGGKVSKKGKK